MLADVTNDPSFFTNLFPESAEPRVRWRYVSTALGRLLIADAGRGLAYLGLEGERSAAGLEAWAQRHAPGALFDEDHGALFDAARQLEQYARGERQTFDLALDLRGPDFHVAVWRALLAIPHGRTTTYGALARELGRLGGARAVGQAAGANPVPIVVPCHRVLAAGGGLGGFSGGLEVKQRLLAHEGALLAVAS